MPLETYIFSDIFDIGALQGLSEALSAAFGVGIGVSDQHGKYLFRSIGTVRCRICLKNLLLRAVPTDRIPR